MKDAMMKGPQGCVSAGTHAAWLVNGRQRNVAHVAYSNVPRSRADVSTPNVFTWFRSGTPDAFRDAGNYVTEGALSVVGGAHFFRRVWAAMVAVFPTNNYTHLAGWFTVGENLYQLSW